jgi:hypothetical protein
VKKDEKNAKILESLNHTLCFLASPKDGKQDVKSCCFMIEQNVDTFGFLKFLKSAK